MRSKGGVAFPSGASRRAESAEHCSAAAMGAAGTADGVVGTVTSGTMSPMLKEGIGMGYVSPEYAAPGTEIAVVIREKPVKATVVKAPFV